MRCLAKYMTIMIALLLPQCGFGQIVPPGSLGPDAYFPSAAAAEQALLFLPLPPAPNSAAQAANIKINALVQSTASPQAVAQAQLEGQSYSVFAFSGVLGPGFTPQNLPVTDTFFNKVTINTQNANYALKDIYNSPGPQTPASYPSTQALLGNINGVLLADMIPEKQVQLRGFGIQFGLDRLIVNAHWPTDVGAAQMETGFLVNTLFASPQFQTDFNAAKAEVRAQQGLK